jgi:hypothetical protein
VCVVKSFRETEVEIEMKKEDLRACGRVFLERKEKDLLNLIGDSKGR